MIRNLLFPFATMLLLSACGSDSSSSPTPPPEPPTATFDLQLLHASSDAPPVDIFFDGSAALGDADYKTGSGRTSAQEGTYPIRVDASTPGGKTTVIPSTDIAFSGDRIYSIIAAGNVGDETLEALVVDQARTAVTVGTARAFIVHAASDPVASSVDVFVTVPDADLTAEAPLNTDPLPFKGTVGPVEVTAGDYQVRITQAGDPAAVVYDSGIIAFADGADLLVAAVNNTGLTGDTAGIPPVSLVVLDGSESAEIRDTTTPAEVRVIHASPNTPSVDVIVDDTLTLVSDVPFPVVRPIVPLDAGTYNFKVQDTSNPGAIFIDENLTMDAGSVYDFFAVNTLAAIEPLVLADDYRRIATEAKLRVIHLSPSTTNVDVFLTDTNDISDATPLRADIPFKQNSGFLGIDPGNYFLAATVAGTTTVIYGPVPVTLAAGNLYTVAVRDAPGGGLPTGVIAFGDF